MKDKIDRYLLLSLAFHLALLVVVWVGVPDVPRRHVLAQRKIPVGIVSASDVARKPAAPPKETRAETPRAEEKKPAPKAETPKPDQPKPKPAPRTPDVAPKPKPKPAPEKKVVADTKKAGEKLPEKKQEKKAEAPEEDFTALLKNIAPPPKKQPKPAEATPDPSAQFASILEGFIQVPQAGRPDGNSLDADELDAWKLAVGARFEPCWGIEPGAAGMKDIAVEARVHVGGDLSIRQVEVLDTARMNRDGVFRVAAERARRALLDARCNPLPKPPSGLDIMNETIILTFDPGAMF